MGLAPISIHITYTQSRANTAISRAEKYLLDQFDEEGDFCNYGLALTTYAISKNATRRQRESRLVTRMVNDLRAAITRSTQCMNNIVCVEIGLVSKADLPLVMK